MYKHYRRHHMYVQQLDGHLAIGLAVTSSQQIPHLKKDLDDLGYHQKSNIIIWQLFVNLSMGNRNCGTQHTIHLRLQIRLAEFRSSRSVAERGHDIPIEVKNVRQYYYTFPVYLSLYPVHSGMFVCPALHQITGVIICTSVHRSSTLGYATQWWGGGSEGPVPWRRSRHQQRHWQPRRSYEGSSHYSLVVSYNKHRVFVFILNYIIRSWVKIAKQQCSKTLRKD